MMSRSAIRVGALAPLNPFKPTPPNTGNDDGPTAITLDRVNPHHLVIADHRASRYAWRASICETRGGGMRMRLVRLIGATVVLMLLAPVPAAMASITEGAQFCSGQATIKGVDYTPANDTPSKAIPIPNEEDIKIPWQGTANFDNSSHNGSLYVNVAGFNIRVATWKGGGVEKGSNGVYELNDFYEELDRIVPIGRVPGVWKVSGEHMGKEDRCAGFAMIRLEGNPLGTLVGWIVIVGLIVTASGMVIAMRVKIEFRKAK